MMRLQHSLLLGATVLCLGACQQPQKADSGSNFKAIDIANMDTTVHPGDNFFMYANGAWLKNNPIPKDQTRWGSFDKLIENTNDILHHLLDSAAGVKGASSGSLVQRVGDFYRSGMDSAERDKAGVEPLKPILNRIDAVKDVQGLLNEIALEHTEGLGLLFGFYVSPDDKNVSKQMCQFSQGGLGMPGREYYFDKDSRTTKVRDAYKKYLPKLLRATGLDSATAAKDANDIYNLELKLASASLSRVEMRDPLKLYNKFTVDEMAKMTPGLDWRKLFSDLQVGGQDSMIVATPNFFKEVAAQMKATPLEVWKKYLKFHMVNDLSSYLTTDLDQLHFDFYGRTLRGQEEQSPRWKRVMRMVDGSIGDLLGQLYVQTYFKPEAKKRMLELVGNLQAAYADRIQKLDWMSAETKVKAIGKLNTFMKKIGYTDKFKEYQGVSIVPNDYVKNIIAASAWEYNDQINKLGKPVDRTEWGMTPSTVNAYYNPAFNEIVFPAGILQYPFFDDRADDAVNYGGIGAVIGHEMTHGFDDQGRLYNAEGNLANWWTSADSAQFVQKSDMVVSQFNKIVVIDTMHANGSLTLGENLADLGGISIAYDAFKKTEQGKGDKKIDGFTPDQRFFLSWAQVWRAATRPEELASRLKTDPHSPSELRANVPVSNHPAWYKAFDIKPTDKMFRPENERAKVW
jgi:putative endopeptidase